MHDGARSLSWPVHARVGCAGSSPSCEATLATSQFTLPQPSAHYVAHLRSDIHGLRREAIRAAGSAGLLAGPSAGKRRARRNHRASPSCGSRTAWPDRSGRHRESGGVHTSVEGNRHRSLRHVSLSSCGRCHETTAWLSEMRMAALFHATRKEPHRSKRGKSRLPVLMPPPRWARGRAALANRQIGRFVRWSIHEIGFTRFTKSITAVSGRRNLYWTSARPSQRQAPPR